MTMSSLATRHASPLDIHPIRKKSASGLHSRMHWVGRGVVSRSYCLYGLYRSSCIPLAASKTATGSTGSGSSEEDSDPSMNVSQTPTPVPAPDGDAICASDRLFNESLKNMEEERAAFSRQLTEAGWSLLAAMIMISIAIFLWLGGESDIVRVTATFNTTTEGSSDGIGKAILHITVLLYCINAVWKHFYESCLNASLCLYRKVKVDMRMKKLTTTKTIT